MSAADHFTTRLPTKRVAADCLIRDDQDRVLLVRPSYKSTWDLPGGVVDQDESPRAAAIREVGEELGITVAPGSLLAVDWIARRGDFTEVLALLFDGGTLDPAQAAGIRVDGREIVEAAFHPAITAATLLDDETALRMDAAVRARRSGTAYLENGVTPR